MPPRNLGWTDRNAAPDVRQRLHGLSVPSGREMPGVAPQPALRTLLPPQTTPLITSQNFTAQDYAMVLAAGVGSTITSAAASFRLPASQVGWLQNFTLYVLTPAATTSVQWTVRINGGPIPGWDNIQNAPGVANLFVGEYNGLAIRIPNGALVDVLITNLNANGPWTVGAKIAGWYHSLADEARVYGSLDEY